MTNDKNYSNNTYVKKLSKVNLTPDDTITVCITNHIIEVTSSRKECVKGFQDIKRLDKNHFLVISTGEIRKY
ncbi:MAG: hypothetical protein Q4B75_04470, partial [Eubacteriales bacterium]|nr:hypothetical protein [Eubacteriales bacterium]